MLRRLFNGALPAIQVLALEWYQRQFMHGELEKAGDGEGIAYFKALTTKN
jgi:hypothetical protein